MAALDRELKGVALGDPVDEARVIRKVEPPAIDDRPEIIGRRPSAAGDGISI